MTLVHRVPVLSEKAAAEFLDLAPGTLRNLRSRGNGPVYSKLPNGRVKYRIDQLERWRDGNTRSSTTEAAAQ